MSALDIGARGLARRAQQGLERTDENAVSIAVRSEPTAAALEALTVDNGLLTGEPGAVYTVEQAPFITRGRLAIRGNGAELRNVSQTPLNVEHNLSAALNLGVSTVWETSYLTYYPVLSASGPELALEAGAGANFAPGDLVVLHGATKFFVPFGEDYGYDVFRNYLRARVISVSGDSVVLDRGLPRQLLADEPVIANADEGMESYLPGAPRYYLLYAPHISNLTIASDVGSVFNYGGVIDGVFRDLEMEGRNGVALNAMQDCLFENIRFRAWRKICELAEGSYGTVVRGLRGTLSDASTRFGGASDVAPFFIGIVENCAECVFENLDVNSGPNNASGGVACQLAAGRNNEIRNSRLRFPAHTGYGVSITSRPEAGMANVDSGYRNVEVHLPSCSVFFAVADLGGGVERPYLVDCKFFGSVVQRAGEVQGNGGLLRNVWCEDGGLRLNSPSTNWRIEGCYFPAGFLNLTPELLKANPGIRDNESDASRRLSAAAIVRQGPSEAITTTEANTAWQTATFAAGDLAAHDRIFVYSEASAGGTGATSRVGRLSITVNGAETPIGTVSRTSAGPMAIEAELFVLNNNRIGYRTNVWGTLVEGEVNIASLSLHAIQVSVKYWVADPANPVLARTCRIVPVKPGMRHLPLR